MATLRSIKKRIKSTGNIKQITKAMEAVSAVKMRKSEQIALSARPFALSGLEILKRLLASPTLDQEAFFSPLMKRRKGAKGVPKCLIVVASDKGLAGSFNANVIKRAIKASEEAGGTSETFEIIAVGKKASEIMIRRGENVIKTYSGFGDFTEIDETKPIAEFVIKNFEAGRWQSVRIIYTNFLSALKQEPVSRKILPFHAKTFAKIVEDIVPTVGKYSNAPAFLTLEDIGQPEYILEPDPKTIIDQLLPELLAVEIHHAILEANASEHSSRMMAMKNASESAGELISDLTIEFNKARQAGITKELLEITAGKEALSNG